MVASCASGVGGHIERLAWVGSVFEAHRWLGRGYYYYYYYEASLPPPPLPLLFGALGSSSPPATHHWEAFFWRVDVPLRLEEADGYSCRTPQSF